MSALKTLQQQVTDQILAQPEFSNVRVVNENMKDIQDIVDQGLGPEGTTVGGVVVANPGLVLIVLTPEANADWENVQGPFLNDVNVLVSIWERVETNRVAGVGTMLAAPDAAELACQALHHWYPLNGSSPMRARRPTVHIVPDPVYLRYNCRFTVMVNLSKTVPQVATPTVIANPEPVIITCATTGAAVFYTLDGTNPSPRNPGARLYTAPFVPGSGVQINARAWLAGYLTSDIATATT